ncbi:MAG: energy transducer TonB [Saprospiraceae bacterium]|nr:energy transducer TonB [Saprospiraceae bacterium]
MKKEKKDDSFIKKPFYKGGQKALNDFVYKELKYPKEALEQKVEGVVIIRYEIDFKGDVADAKVLKSLGHGCDEEALRVVRLLKFEVPKAPRKLKILFHKDIQVQFKPVKAVIKPQATETMPAQMVYQVVKENKTKSQAKPAAKGNTITYTFKF